MLGRTSHISMLPTINPLFQQNQQQHYNWPKYPFPFCHLVVVVISYIHTASTLSPLFNRLVDLANVYLQCQQSLRLSLLLCLPTNLRMSLTKVHRKQKYFRKEKLHCAGGAKTLTFLDIFSRFWWLNYAYTANFGVALRFVQGTNTLVVPGGVSATGDMSPVSPLDIAPMQISTI